MTSPEDRALRLVCVNQQDDDELVTRLRAGDWSALDGLYHRYALPVFQRCWRVLRERDVSWQVTHDTFAAFLAHLPCRCGRPLREWLFDTCARLSTQAADDRSGR
jgi:hypothetical protein